MSTQTEIAVRPLTSFLGAEIERRTTVCGTVRF
jgi:hypothetical protein